MHQDTPRRQFLLHQFVELVKELRNVLRFHVQQRKHDMPDRRVVLDLLHANSSRHH
jgi:hypothetical protein